MDNISTFRLSCHDSARILPDRKASIDPCSLEALDLKEGGSPFRLETTVPQAQCVSSKLVMYKSVFTCDCYSDFFQFVYNHGTVVKTINVEVVPFVVQTFNKGFQYSSRMGQFRSNLLGVLSKVHPYLVQIPRHTVCKNKGLYTPRVWFSL